VFITTSTAVRTRGCERNACVCVKQSNSCTDHCGRAGNYGRPGLYLHMYQKVFVLYEHKPLIGVTSLEQCRFTTEIHKLINMNKLKDREALGGSKQFSKSWRWSLCVTAQVSLIIRYLCSITSQTQAPAAGGHGYCYSMILAKRNKQ
jgi:hypothetical protein